LELSQTGMPVFCEEGCDCPRCSSPKPTAEHPRIEAFIRASVGHESAAPSSRFVPSNGSLPSISAAALEALDLLNIGLLLTNSDCRLLHANRAAQGVLEAGKLLCVDAAGFLRTAKGVRPTLAEVLRKATEENGSEKSDRSNLVTTIRSTASEQGVTILAAKPQLFPGHSSPVLPVLLFSSSTATPASPAALHSIFSFTSTESIMANLVMEGLSRDDCGAYLNVRPTTIAFHLKNMFRKTGSRCQAQLISKLFKAIGLIQAASFDANVISQECLTREPKNVGGSLEIEAADFPNRVTPSRYLSK